jgi:hypothetical protein
MNNREIQAAWKYHDGSKHSYWSIRNHPHFLDWANFYGWKYRPTLDGKSGKKKVQIAQSE